MLPSAHASPQPGGLDGGTVKPNSTSIGSVGFARVTSECRRACQSMSCPSKLLLLKGKSGLPSNAWLLGSTRLSIANGISVGSAVFVQLMADSPYTLQQAAPSTCPKIAPSHVGSGPHLIHGSLSLPELTKTQTASRSVQPFCKVHNCDRQTDRPTDHATRSVTKGRIYVLMYVVRAMRPNNNKWSK